MAPDGSIIDALVEADARRLARAAASELVALARRAVDARGAFVLALAGGGTPLPLYRALAGPVGDALPWRQTTGVYGDERCVAKDDPQTNAAAARAALLDHRPAAVVHLIDGVAEPSDAAGRYAAVIEGLSLDVALLGVGLDGHTASLFPGGPGLDADDPLVVPARAPAAPRSRISLSLGALCAARSIRFLVSGEAKAAVVARVAREVHDGEPRLPASRVAHGAADVRWWLDRAAASALEPPPR